MTAREYLTHRFYEHGDLRVGAGLIVLYVVTVLACMYFQRTRGGTP